MEFAAEVRERMEGVNSLNDAVDTKELCDFPEHWQAIHVEPGSGMTEKLRDVEKVSRAAAQIENLLGARQVELNLTNPSNVNFDPAIEIEIFRPVRARICYSITLANLFETRGIDCFDNALCLKRD